MGNREQFEQVLHAADNISNWWCDGGVITQSMHKFHIYIYKPDAYWASIILTKLRSQPLLTEEFNPLHRSEKHKEAKRERKGQPDIKSSRHCPCPRAGGAGLRRCE